MGLVEWQIYGEIVGGGLVQNIGVIRVSVWKIVLTAVRRLRHPCPGIGGVFLVRTGWPGSLLEPGAFFCLDLRGSGFLCVWLDFGTGVF